jgi:cysteinyl-tRNA synthetase
MKLKFYNTLTRKLEPFEPIEPGHVRIYTCGPTIYDFPHIGNYRTFLFEDILRRTLQLFGFQVTQVMNLTDVDDRTIQRSAEAEIPLREYTDRYAEAFFEDLRTLRVQPAEHYPRATDYIPEMVALVQRLESSGHSYRSEGSIYYRIGSFPTYGRLSGVRPEGNLVGARVDADDYEKEDARDFVLWKAAKPGEPSWQTEIGVGRPGWHLECSAMSMSLLGESFDIHCGGVDNIFPHHENEIAQSEGATGAPLARYWLHAEHLIVGTEKMAKRLGNFHTLRELLDEGHDPTVVRYLLISVPYRQRLNFTFDSLHAAAQATERIANTLRRLEHSPDVQDDGDLAADVIATFVTDFRASLADDLNTARALGALHTLLRQVNTALDGSGISSRIRKALDDALHEADSVLDVFPSVRPAEAGADDEIRRLVEQRDRARGQKEFTKADEIRDRLLDMGFVLEDTPHGTVWHRRKDPGARD